MLIGDADANIETKQSKVKLSIWSIKAKFIKCSLYMFNSLIFLQGTALALIGILFHSFYKYDQVFIYYKMNTFSVFLFVIGLLLVILSLIGCISVLPSCVNSMMVACYIFGLFVTSISLASYGAAIYAQFNNKSLLIQLTNEMNNTFKIYDEKKKGLFETEQIDYLQRQFKCCGLYSYKYWDKQSGKALDASATIGVPILNKNELLLYADQIAFDLPDTCCIKESENCGKDFRRLATVYMKGCFEPLWLYLSNRLLFMCYVSIGMAVLIFLTVSFLIFVSLTLKGDYSLINSNESLASMNVKNRRLIGGRGE
jgi:hypothetical protein